MTGYEDTESRVRTVLPFQAEPSELRVLRRAVRKQLSLWGALAAADEVLLVVTELATNIIKHVGEGVAATLVLESSPGILRVEAHDKSDVLPVAGVAACEEECGRGLHLLAAMAAGWGTILTATGKAVWCELALEPATHCRRIQRAAAALEGYREAEAGVGALATSQPAALDDAATSLIADLLHLLAAQGRDPDDVLDQAQVHFEAEAA